MNKLRKWIVKEKMNEYGEVSLGRYPNVASCSASSNGSVRLETLTCVLVRRFEACVPMGSFS